MADEFDGGMGVLVEGVTEAKAALDAMDARIDRMTVAALKSVQALAKREIKKQIKGKPRWDHRGRSTRTGDEVNLHLNPHRQPRSGGPGILTGTLKRGVGGVRRPRKIGEEFHGGVGVGGGVRNLYKGRTEQKFPYLKPGVEAAEPKMPAIWEGAWAKATGTGARYSEGEGLTVPG